jgi:hypothetical protein
MNDCVRTSRRELIVLAAAIGPARSPIMATPPPQEPGQRSVNADQAFNRRNLGRWSRCHRLAVFIIGTNVGQRRRIRLTKHRTRTPLQAHLV